MNKAILITVICTISASALLAQDAQKNSGKKLEEMNVDFPDETQETDLVEKGQWQIETAFLYNIYSEGKRSAIGQGLLRYGVSKRVELRLLVEQGRGLKRYIAETVQSTYPISASIKIAIIKDHPVLPDITLISYLQLPFKRKNDDSTLYWSPIFLLASKHKFGDKWMLEYNAGIQEEAYSTQWAWLVNAALHYKITDQLELFTEYYSQYQHHENPQHNIGAGLSYQLNNNIEFYVMGGSTVNYNKPNHFFTGGVAFKMP